MAKHKIVDFCENACVLLLVTCGITIATPIDILVASFYVDLNLTLAAFTKIMNICAFIGTACLVLLIVAAIVCAAIAIAIAKEKKNS